MAQKQRNKAPEMVEGKQVIIHLIADNLRGHHVRYGNSEYGAPDLLTRTDDPFITRARAVYQDAEKIATSVLLTGKIPRGFSSDSYLVAERLLKTGKADVAKDNKEVLQDDSGNPYLSFKGLTVQKVQTALMSEALFGRGFGDDVRLDDNVILSRFQKIRKNASFDEKATLSAVPVPLQPGKKAPAEEKEEPPIEDEPEKLPEEKEAPAPPPAEKTAMRPWSADISEIENGLERLRKLVERPGSDKRILQDLEGAYRLILSDLLSRVNKLTAMYHEESEGKALDEPAKAALKADASALWDRLEKILGIVQYQKEHNTRDVTDESHLSTIATSLSFRMQDLDSLLELKKTWKGK